MKRVKVAELMDRATPDPDRLEQSLRDLGWVNRYLGGTAAVVHPLKKLLYGYESRSLRVLDVAAGGGDVLRSIARWCGSRDLVVEGIALDSGRLTTRYAERAFRSVGSRDRTRTVRADARGLPFEAGSVDVSVCSTFLHHLNEADAVIALREMARVSRWGLVACDLRRGVAGYLAAELLARTLWRDHAYARHDGPASMRAAFTLDEASALARRADLEAHVSAQPGFRWAIRWKRPN